ncbi:Tex family protein [Lentilactobacillus laojiaonis]|uniref:Tex family protein n=1 Tax=Lentilactobacillus laojiaonis TaxID=2883998 RepID=UPI001D0AC27F|nr:Tex family protein [Lentilactobacillus laojiaonis]UDM31899.1 RNA-binding transcriptional accessory protein [Lentilactobacillus laojiaonis]
MTFNLIEEVHQSLSGINTQQIKATLEMLNDGDTVPFIARYRKERTHNLDEVQIRDIQEIAHKVTTLNNRKDEVTKKISEQGMLTKQLQTEINQATNLQQVEDLYLPYKQKRRTKAAIAKEQGLEPLAQAVLKFNNHLSEKINQAIDPNQDLADRDSVITGIHEILSEYISEQASFRKWIRGYTKQTGLLVSKVKRNGKAEDEKQVYQQYYDFEELIKTVPSFRVLAINRGEKSAILTVKIKVDEIKINQYLHHQLVKSENNLAQQLIDDAIGDAYSRFIGPAIEREIRKELTEIADRHAIDVFGNNLYNLLMQAPLKGKIVMGFDPAYRTGCKLAIMDQNGAFLAKKVIYPHKPASEAKRKQAMPEFIDFVEKYHVEMIAIGNGTASRESELFVAEAIKKIGYPVYYVITNEAGASVYSASKVAREEFPDFNVEERSAVSIGRRIQDPLAELVKIDPQSIGVGQYQHDVSQKNLTQKLDQVVETAVNQVGIDLNSASPDLLTHISGLSKTVANNIVKYRLDNGKFIKRSQLQQVPRLGPKAYEQSVGFLRIIDGNNPLDNTDIHPENYTLAKKILAMYHFDLKDLGSEELAAVLAKVDLDSLADQLEIGKVTLVDIIKGLITPGRDVRDNMNSPLLRQDVLSMEDLKVGMQLKGTVRNVVDFGVFVDIGVKQDGLVHISQLTDQFIKNPAEVVSVGEIVNVWVTAVDLDRQRIQLTMIEPKEG